MTSDEDVAKKCRLITTNYDGRYSLQTISPVTRTKLSLIVIHVAEGHNSDFIFFACSAIVLVDFVVIFQIINKVVHVQHPRVIYMAR